MREVEKGYVTARHGGIIEALEKQDREAAIRCLVEHLETSTLNYNFPSEDEVEYR